MKLPELEFITESETADARSGERDGWDSVVFVLLDEEDVPDAPHPRPS